jgi:transcriptional regulator with XRE-family HTH domain
MKANREKPSDRIRRAVNAAGVTRYRLCKASGVDQGTMSRFMAGKGGLPIESLDALADVLGLDVVARGPVRVSPPVKSGPKPKKGAKP